MATEDIILSTQPTTPSTHKEYNLNFKPDSKRYSPIRQEIMDSFITQLCAMQSHYSKVFAFRFDLSVPAGMLRIREQQVNQRPVYPVAWQVHRQALEWTADQEICIWLGSGERREGKTGSLPLLARLAALSGQSCRIRQRGHFRTDKHTLE